MDITECERCGSPSRVKKRVNRSYLTMTLEEAFSIYLETYQPPIHLWETSREGGTEKKPVYFTYKEAMAKMKDLRAYKEHSRIKWVQADHFQHE